MNALKIVLKIHLKSVKKTIITIIVWNSLKIEIKKKGEIKVTIYFVIEII